MNTLILSLFFCSFISVYCVSNEKNEASTEDKTPLNSKKTDKSPQKSALSIEAEAELQVFGIENADQNVKQFAKIKVKEAKEQDQKISEKDQKISEKDNEIGSLRTEKKRISDLRVIRTVRTRMEYLEDVLYPEDFAYQANRYHRWLVILHTKGDAREEFRALVLEEFRKVEKFKGKSDDYIIDIFAGTMLEIYPILSNNQQGPHKTIAPEILRTLEKDGADKDIFFEMMGIQLIPKNEKALAAVSSDKLTLTPDPKPFGNLSDFRCIVITRRKHKNFPKKHGIKEITVRRFYPTVNVESVTFAIGDQREKVEKPKSLKEEVSVTGVDKIIVKFETYGEATKAYRTHQKKLRHFHVDQKFQMCPLVPECTPDEGNTPMTPSKTSSDVGSRSKI